MANPVLRGAREKFDLTQAQLGAVAGISGSQVSRYESGEKDDDIKVTEVIAFAKRLGLTIPELVSPYLSAADHYLLGVVRRTLVDPAHLRTSLIVLLEEHLSPEEAERSTDRLLEAAHRQTWSSGRESRTPKPTRPGADQ